MTFPNPANYFLPMPEQFEKEIEKLEKADLYYLVYEIAQCMHLNGGKTGEISLCDMTQEFDDYISDLTESNQIQLLRYLTERLSYKAHFRPLADHLEARRLQSA